MKKQLLTTLSILAVTISAFAQSAGGGACSELFISEYVEGTGNNRAIELFNPTPNPVNLSNYSVGRYANGITTGMFSNLAGTIAPYDTYVIALDKRDPNGVELEIPISAALEAAADTFLNPVYVASNSPMYFNGNDAVALRKFGTVIDILGTIGENPAIGWFDFATGNWSTENQTLVRKPNVQEGDWNGFDTYYPDFEWDNYAVNTFSNLGSHTNSCFTPPCSTPSAVGFSGLNTSYNTSDAPTTLTGSPAGGVFFGDGLDGNDFNPAFAGVGTHSIVYTYVDGNGCIGSYGLCTTVDFNVGIGGTEISTTNNIDVYPNPSTDKFYLSFDNVDGIVSYSVYDAMGKEVKTDAFVANGFTEKTISLNKLANGIYTLQLNTTKGTFSEKLVKE